MKFVVIGLGSMGKRRIRLLKQIDANFSIIGVDSNLCELKKVKTEFNIKVTDDLDSALEKYVPDCAIVSLPPKLHAEVIQKCLKANCHVFSEINLVKDGYDENILLAQKNNRVLFLSSTFLYRKEIEYIENSVLQSSEKFNYIYHIGQYLPDWHPWVKLSDFFISKKDTNGCREILAIELPWIIKCFGKIQKISVLSSKNTNLPIDFPDNYLIQILHENGHKGSLIVDVISRKAVRYLEVLSENLHLTWNGTPESLTKFDITSKKDLNVNLYASAIEHEDGYEAYVVENAYKAELLAFIQQIRDNIVPKYSFLDDKYVIDVIDEIEKQ